MAGGKTNDKIRRDIVIRLAQYDTPSMIIKDLQREHGITMTISSVRHYDPSIGGRPAKKWRELFEVARKDFLANTSQHVPTANKAVRMRMMDQAAQQYREKGNFFGMKQMLEGIAKEDGGAFTNRREHTGKDGGPISYRDVGEMTPDEIKAELMQLMTEAMGGAQ